MNKLFPILLFFVYLWGFGYSVTYFLKKGTFSKSWLERQLMNMGIGLGVWSILIIIVNQIGLPLDWKLFLLWSLVIPVFSLYEYIAENGLKLKIPAPKLKKSTIYIIIAIIIAFSVFYVLHKGTFTYPWLEDGDPWEHATGTLYVSETKTFSRSPEDVMNPLIHYLEPYPPSYDSMMGILRPVYPDTNWVLKFFNVLMIGLGHLWFYFFAKIFMRDSSKALFATFAFAVTPCFLGHFIWSSTLALVLYFPAFYCIEKLRKEDFNWIYPSIAVIAGIMVAQPTDNFFFGLMFGMYYLVLLIQKRKWYWRIFFAGFFGLLLSLITFWIPIFLKFSLDQINSAMNIWGSIKNYAAGGTQARFYTLNDFAISPLANMFDNPTGFGIVLFSLAMLGGAILLIRYIRFIFQNNRLLSKKNVWMTITFVWLVFGLVGTNGARLPFMSLYPYRFWSKLAIPMAIVAAEAFMLIYMWFRSQKRKELAFIFTILVIVGMLWTSGYPKYTVQTSWWAAHIFNNPQEMQVYTVLDQLPPNLAMFHLCKKGGMRAIEERFIGYGMYNKFWDKEQRRMKDVLFNQTTEGIYTFLDSNGYDYLVIDYSCVNDYGLNETNDKLMEIGNSRLFKPIIQQSPLYVLELVKA